MKKAGLYILFFAVFIDSPFFQEMWKLPALLQHYREHHQLDNKIDMPAFLAMHYWGHDLNDNDDDKDMRLPFKKTDCKLHAQTAFPQAKVTLENPQEYNLQTSWPVMPDRYLLQPDTNALFRPPRV